MAGSRGDFSSLADIAQNVGYIKGTLDSLKTQNALDHTEIKASLAVGTAEFVLIRKTLDLQERCIADVERRVAKIEKHQAGIAGMAKFISDHPKLVVLFLSSVSVAFLVFAGLGIDDIIKIIGL
jgi:hypothetical protein